MLSLLNSVENLQTWFSEVIRPLALSTAPGDIVEWALPGGSTAPGSITFSGFDDIYLLEYWFGGANGPGRGINSTASEFTHLELQMDNVEIVPSMVPVPTAFILFATGTIGLVGNRMPVIRYFIDL